MLRSICAAVAIVAAPFALSCNDGIQCPTGALVLITSPVGDVLASQVDVHVRTTLAQGEALALTATDANGATVASATTTADADGSATFTGVTLPSGKVTITVTATGACGDDSNSITVNVVAGSGCAVAISPAPADNPYYAPLQVLNAAADPDPATAGFQATVTATTATGWSVDFYLTTPGQPETLFATMTAAQGSAAIAPTLPDGRNTVRAVCRDPGSGTTQASPSSSVVVDTTPPTCGIAQPAPGSTITPAYDVDHDLSNGLQLALGGAVGGGDVMGEATSFRVIAPDGSMTDLPGTTVDGSGATGVVATLAPASTPASYAIELRTQDHAGNPCLAAHEDYQVVYDGCSIQLTAPTAAVTTDADGNAANGAQVDASLVIDPACAGRTVTTDCGVAPSSATVPPSGDLTMRLTACGADPCQVSQACAFHVTNAAGITTSAGLALTFDDQSPTVSLAIVNPAVACGAQLGADADVDPALDGVQVTARVTASADAATRQVRVQNASGTSTVDATADVEVTIAAGANTLFGIAADALGNTATTPGCGLTLSDLTVSFGPPAADGMLSARDGTVNGNNLTTNICGAVSKTGATVTLKVDGGAAQPATVNGTSWCRQVTLAASPPSHTLVASATAGTSFGSATLIVAVDLTAPGAITDLVATAPNRATIHATWTAPADGSNPADHYVVKLATTPLTIANFDATGALVPTSAPLAPGSPETLDVKVRPGASYWIGIAAADLAGNEATPAIVGPLAPAFDQTGAIVAPDAASGAQMTLGWSFAHGKFNDDAYEDVAVGAPNRNNGTTVRAGAVYVWFGGPTGLSSTPVIIQGVESNGSLGSSVTAVRWSSSTRDDLAIGAPLTQGSRGQVFIFHGGATFPTSGTVNATAADQVIGANPVNAGWFGGAELGWSLATADFDGDGTPDLAAGAIYGGGTKGGVVVLFGGTADAAKIALSDVDASGLAGAEAQILQNPNGTTGTWWGRYLYGVGRTTGASDPDDDLLIGQTDDLTTTGDSVWLYRGAGPRVPGVSFRSFTVGNDVRIDDVTTYNATGFGSQAASVPDMDGDGARDLVIGSWQYASNAGQVVFVSGATLGTAGVARTGDPGVVLATINGLTGQRLGVAIATRALTSGDVDVDGKDDLLVAGLVGGAARLYTWFGGAIPLATMTTASATYVVTGPSTFKFSSAPPNPPGMASWVGDVNGDGLDDLCWSSPFDNNRAGSFELLWDNGL